MSTEITTYNTGSLIDPRELEGMTITLDRIKMPSGGGLAFEVPGDDPDRPDMLSEILGVIVDHHPSSVTYFDRPEDRKPGDDDSPDAFSDDGVTQQLSERAVSAGMLDLLDECPANKWGSYFDKASLRVANDGRRGKLTKNQRRIYILPEGSVLPLVLVLSPTGLAEFDNYLLKRVLGRGRKLIDVVTRVSLTRTQNAQNITYSKVQFGVAGEVPADQRSELLAYADGVKVLTRRKRDTVPAIEAVTAPVAIEAGGEEALEATFRADEWGVDTGSVV